MNSFRVGGSGSANQSQSHGHSYVAIPAAAKKVVQSLKEIVKNHSDEEIYSTLKECNMDPNDAVHKLINQDTFHEVKRKRDKKREILKGSQYLDDNFTTLPNGSNNDSGETKTKSFVGPPLQGGRVLDRGGNKVNYVPRHLMSDGGGGSKWQFTNAREDGDYQMYRDTSTTSQSQSQARSIIPRASNSAASFGPAGMKGRPYHTRAAPQATRGSWSKVSRHGMPTDSKWNSTTDAAAPSVGSSVPMRAGSTNDAVPRPFSESGAAKKQEVVFMEKYRTDDKQEQGLPDEVGPVAVSFLESVQTSNPLTSHPNPVSEGKITVKPVCDSAQPHVTRAHQNAYEEQKKPTTGTSGARPLFHNYYNTRASYQPHQQLAGTQRAPSALEWKPKPPVALAVPEEVSPQTSPADETDRSSPPIPSPVGNKVSTIASSKPEELNLQDDRPVIIPDHLQVPEAECAGLNFGSFDTDFEVNFSTGLNLDDSKGVTTVEITVSTEVPPDQPIESSVTELPPVETTTPSHSQLPTPAETFVTSNDAVLSVPPIIVRPAEISKPQPITQQGRQFSYVPTVPSYQGFGLVPQPQYPYESAESQPQEIPRLPNFVQPFTDSAPNYFSPIFRPGSDADTRYQFLSSNGTSKFSGNVTLMNGQTLSSSQELSQNAGIPHTTFAMGQPSLPVHAYAAQPAGVTISPYATNVYGYQYVPPNYAYMHSSYQNSYSGNSGYPQPPVGTSFASTARVYPPAGTATLKYPPPQYKLGMGNAPHALVAAGYGSFATTPSGFAAINSTVTTGSASSYDDMVGSQYKENTQYTSTHQVEGSTVWVQAPLSRDISGMQTNSFYNLHGQGQHAGYTHSQPAHAHPAAGFASYAQSASGSNNHHLLQQPQPLGSMGVGSQAVIFPQPQRGQVNWASNYSNLIRS